MLELHAHTTYSDGSLTPGELVAAAIAAQVSALAITDHDSIAGWAEAEAAAQGTGLEIVPGVELSTMERGRSLHLLGFYPEAARLSPLLAERLQSRWQRAAAMVEKLQARGYAIELPVLPQGAAPGRPHLAQALVAAGYMPSVEKAFQKLLKDDGPAFVPYAALSATEGIGLLRAAGAVPVWAHPGLFKAAPLAELLPELMAAGLMGLEVYHPGHSPKQTRQLLDGCDRTTCSPPAAATTTVPAAAPPAPIQSPSSTDSKSPQPSSPRSKRQQSS